MVDNTEGNNPSIEVSIAGGQDVGVERPKLSDRDFLPALSDIEESSVARQILAKGKSVETEVENLITVFEMKQKQLRELRQQYEQGVADGDTEKDLPDYATDISRLDRLLAVLRSEHSYEDLIAILSPDEIQNMNLTEFEDVFSTSGRFLGRIVKRDEYSRKIDLANKTARRNAEDLVSLEMKRMEAGMDADREGFNAFFFESSLDGFRKAGDIDGVTASQAQVSENIDEFTRFKKRTEAMREHMDRIKEKFADSNADRVLILIRECESRVIVNENKLKNIEERADYLLSDSALNYWLKEEIGTLSRKISVQRNGRAEWSHTQEYAAIIERINRRLEYVAGVAGLEFGGNGADINGFYYDHYQIKRARDISGGRVLTHISFISKMFEILRDGLLSSAIALDARGIDSWGKRSFTQANSRSDERETHQICFNINTLYHNILVAARAGGHSSDTEAKVAIVLSENQLLEDGKQFVDFDGTHIFPSDYDPRRESRGLEIDLRMTPFTLLTTADFRQDLVDFLTGESAWSQYLGSLPEDKRNDWLEKHITVVDSFNGWYATDEFIQEFHRNGGIVPKTGFVYVTDHESRFKEDKRTLLRFMACD